MLLSLQKETRINPHTHATHVQPDVQAQTTSQPNTPGKILHPLSFKKFIEISINKLASDECYSDKLRKEFSSYKESFDDAAFCY